MKRCRTRAGELRLRHEGKDYVLTASGMDLPNELAESIRPHVNIIVEDVAFEAAPKAKAEGKR